MMNLVPTNLSWNSSFSRKCLAEQQMEIKSTGKNKESSFEVFFLSV